MNLVLIGPPGAGKGTQAEGLKIELHLPLVVTGEIFRQALKEGTPVGLEAKEYMDKGELVPDEIVERIIFERMGEGDTGEGFILDGFPRNLHQAEALDGYLKSVGDKVDVVLDIEAPEGLLMRRLTGRRVCRSCGVNFHVAFNPPRVEGLCDSCGGELYQRDDDNEETVRNRLRVYQADTAPVIDHYRLKGILVEIDGSDEQGQVFERIVRELEKLRAHVGEE